MKMTTGVWGVLTGRELLGPSRDIGGASRRLLSGYRRPRRITMTIADPAVTLMLSDPVTTVLGTNWLSVAEAEYSALTFLVAMSGGDCPGRTGWIRQA